MGLSSKDSRLFYIPHGCPIRLNGTPPSGTPRRLSEQVTRIEINPTVYERKYGHDKSYGAQDVCAGIKSWDGSITTKVADGDRPLSLTAGDVVWVQVWPIGTQCNRPLRGYANIGSDPIVMNLENGEPVEHNYRFSSKGLWRGFPNQGQQWGGFECQCGDTGGGSASAGGASSWGAWSSSGGGFSFAAKTNPDDQAAPADELVMPSELAPSPQIVYQWNGSRWIVGKDECREGFVPGPAPTNPGAFVGQLAFVDCEVG